jgi:hypothetical protein
VREKAKDAAAEAERAQAALRRLELKRQKDRVRKKKSRRNQRAAEAGKPSATDAEVTEPSDASAAGEGPLSDLAGEPLRSAPAAADMQATAAAIAKQLDTPEKLAGLLAHMQRAAQEKASGKHPRVGRVIAALDLADPKGEPTEWGKLAISFTWPWWQTEGLGLLQALDPRTQALIGLAMLVVPAAFVAIGEYQEHALEREVRVRQIMQERAAAAAGTRGGDVVDMQGRKAEPERN